MPLGHAGGSIYAMDISHGYQQITAPSDTIPPLPTAAVKHLPASLQIVLANLP